MHHVPPEIWDQVCSFSDNRSLKKIRLVNSTLNKSAARHLFNGLCVTLIPEYLDKVTEVAFHPTLRSHVRTLYFNYNILRDDCEDYDLWAMQIDHQRLYYDRLDEASIKFLDLLRWSQSDLERFHKKFCSLRASQNDCFDSRIDLAVLSTALAQLPNLRTIKSIDTTPDYDAPTILSDLQRKTFLLKSFLDPDNSTQSGMSRPLASLISGLGLTRKRILSMDFNKIAWSFWVDKGPSGFQPDAARLIDAAFRYLESMTLRFVVDVEDLHVRLQGMLPRSMSRFIGSARRLRQLDLFFSPCWNHGKGSEYENSLMLFCPRAGRLLAALTLPNLAIFRLRCCTLTENALKAFITRHSTMLKEVWMGAVILDNRSCERTSWEKTLKYIAPLLFLNSAMLYFLCSDDIESFVLAGDPDRRARKNRNDAYCQALTEFLLQGGRTECPRILDFARR